MIRAKYFLISIVTTFVLLGISTTFVNAKCLEAQEPDPADFDSPQNNIYFPWDERTYIYQADAEDELVLNMITVTSNTLDILGVECTVIHDVEYVSIDNGNTWILIEETDDWHAWDNDGNVWYFGEDTLEYVYDDDWNFLYTTDEGSWKAGDDDALPGILMLADPMMGECYQQEYYEGEAEDMGRVLKLNANVSIDFGDYEDCLKTKEWTPLEPGAIEHKYYAPGVGLVYIEELKEKTVEVELIGIIY